MGERARASAPGTLRDFKALKPTSPPRRQAKETGARRALPPPRLPRQAPRAQPARAGERREAGREEAGGAEGPAKRAAAGPPAGGCGAPGAWRQLCGVTRWEDCRARSPGLRAASEPARALRRSRHCARSPPPPARRPAARTNRPSPPPAALPRREAARARRSGASAGPRRSARRSAAPSRARLRSGGSGSFASVSAKLRRPAVSPPSPPGGQAATATAFASPERGLRGPDAERMGRRLQMPKRPETPVRQ